MHQRAHRREVFRGQPGGPGRGQESASQRFPLLRKDFICDPYQIYEARAAGADAVLLIVAALTPELLRELHALARGLGMAALVEVHTAEELETALTCEPALVGINNRDLHTFAVSLETTRAPVPRVARRRVRRRRERHPHAADVATVAAIPRPDVTGVDAILVGEALVTAPDVASAGARAGRSRAHGKDRHG